MIPLSPLFPHFYQNRFKIENNQRLICCFSSPNSVHAVVLKFVLIFQLFNKTSKWAYGNHSRAVCVYCTLMIADLRIPTVFNFLKFGYDLSDKRTQFSFTC